MIRQNWKSLLASSLLVLLPIAVGLLLWDRLPDTLPTHWGIDGQADGWSTKPFAVFVQPLLLLLLHWLCVLVTAIDPKNKDRNHKIRRVLLWTVPVLSNLCGGFLYVAVLGLSFDSSRMMALILGAAFLILGNYLPKCRQNSTIGIKVPWALRSEENWNATHRFGGKVWVIGGLVMMFSAFLPGDWAIAVMFAITLFLFIIPVVYSYLYYRRQLAQGEDVPALSGGIRTVYRITFLFVIAIFAAVAVLLFTGRVQFEYGDTAFTVKASYYRDLTVTYDTIESMEYRQGNVDGTRVNGLGSFRLLLGSFENQEFGNYIRYTYYDPEACVILTVNGKTLVLSGADGAETRSLYDTLLQKGVDGSAALEASVPADVPPEETGEKTQVNGTWLFLFLLDLLCPMIMVVSGFWFSRRPPKKINALVGYRTEMSSKNPDTWEFAHKFHGRLSLRWGVRMLVLTVVVMLAILPLGEEAATAVGLTAMFLQIAILIATIPVTEKALRNTFDRDGHRR